MDGSDRHYGSSGNDQLAGGTGQDTFICNAAAEAGRPESSDVINDFKSGDDHLDVHAFLAGGHPER